MRTPDGSRRNLPLSDAARERLWNILGVLAAGLMIPAFALIFSFYRTGSVAPDPFTNRIFPFQMHGTLYVLPWEAWTVYALFLGAFVLLTAAVVINPWHGRIFPRQDDGPPS